MAARKAKKVEETSDEFVFIANNTKRLITINLRPGLVIQRTRFAPGVTRVRKDTWDEMLKLKWVQAQLDEGFLSDSKFDVRRAQVVTQKAVNELSQAPATDA